MAANTDYFEWTLLGTPRILRRDRRYKKDVAKKKIGRINDSRQKKKTNIKRDKQLEDKKFLVTTSQKQLKRDNTQPTTVALKRQDSTRKKYMTETQTEEQLTT